MTDDAQIMNPPPPDSIFGVASDFLKRQGLTGALLFVIVGMLWFDRQDRREAIMAERTQAREDALFVKDASAKMQQLGMIVQAHVDETKESDEETLRVLRALCVNAAATSEDRARCLGR